MAVSFIGPQISIPNNGAPKVLTRLSESERGDFLEKIDKFSVVFVKGFMFIDKHLEEVLYCNSTFYHSGSSQNFDLNFVVAYDDSLSYEENFLYSPIFRF